jgi:hypothetical protein
MSGYVYLIGNDKFHWFKIGKSKTPEIRVGNLGILLPFKIKVFAIWKADNHHKMESALHEIHADARINGEWFSFSDKRVQAIYESIPREACVFWHCQQTESAFSNFSNMEKDIISTKPPIVQYQVEDCLFDPQTGASINN